jgi:uncharacterized protein (TIGR00290 family)
MKQQQLNLLNWSSGKDAAMALYLANLSHIPIHGLLTTTNALSERVSMHGIRKALLERQAASVGLPLHLIELPDPCPMETYNSLMRAAMERYAHYEVKTAIFGDIFLDDLRKYREAKLQEAGFAGSFPLWGLNTTKLAKDIIQAGFKAVLVCVQANKLDPSFLGREFDMELLMDLPEDVDPCGENGEFHTFVYDGPVFKKAIKVKKGKVAFKSFRSKGDKGEKPYDTDFIYLDLLPY